LVAAAAGGRDARCDGEEGGKGETVPCTREKRGIGPEEKNSATPPARRKKKKRVHVSAEGSSTKGKKAKKPGGGKEDRRRGRAKPFTGINEAKRKKEETNSLKKENTCPCSKKKKFIPRPEGKKGIGPFKSTGKRETETSQPKRAHIDVEGEFSGR